MSKRILYSNSIVILLMTAISCFVFVGSQVKASEGDSLGSTVELLDFSLQELMVLQVTSVSRRSQRQFDAAAAVYTITRDDIQDMGITSIPDALRMVPGMQVARLNGNTWSASARGFNYVFANKVLVLIDGRTVYSSLFSGVNWDVQNVVLEDIDRIEVIRGPGAALWGANAVNGVINIITRHSEDTQGGLISASVGTEERAAGLVRYGGELSEESFYRVFVRGFDRDAQVKVPSGRSANDNWHMRQAGFRFDYYLSDQDELTLQGGVYQGTTKPPYYVYNLNQHAFEARDKVDRDQNGGNVIARYKQSLGDGELILKSYYEKYLNDDLRLKEGRETWDLEFQHSFPWWDTHHFIWGGNYRVDWYNLDDRDKRFISIEDRKFNEELYSVFAQDSFKLRPDLDITLSARMENNRVTGNEFQPNMRFAWTPNRETTVWGAVSKAVKTPALSETSLTITNISYLGKTDETGNGGLFYGIPSMFSVSGNPKLDSEKLTAFDFGIRKQINPDLSVDLAGYLNFYKDVTSYEESDACVTPGFETYPLSRSEALELLICDDPAIRTYVSDGNGGFVPRAGVVAFPTSLTNGLKVFTHGLELALDWKVRDWWRLRLNYSYINVDADSSNKDGYGEANEDIVEGIAAKHTANLLSSFKLPEQWTLNIWLRYISKLHLDPHYEVNNIKANTNADIKLSKEIRPGLEFSIVGQNLLDSQQQQFYEVFTGQMQTEVQRSVYVNVHWAF